MSTNNDNGSRKSVITIAVGAILVLIVAIVLIVSVSGGKSEKITGQLDTEVWLDANGQYKVKNENDVVTLKINSDLNYEEGTELVVPYTLVINDEEYTGEYTFATGYSIHSEPNGLNYTVKFVGIKKGSIGLMIKLKENQ